MEEEGPGKRDIHVHARAREGQRGQIQRIHNLHASYDPLHFTLLHPRGEPGWHPTISLGPAAVRDGGVANLVDVEAGAGGGGDGIDPAGADSDDDGVVGHAANGRGKQQFISAKQYYAYFMHDREPQVRAGRHTEWAGAPCCDGAV